MNVSRLFSNAIVIACLLVGGDHALAQSRYVMSPLPRVNWESDPMEVPRLINQNGMIAGRFKHREGASTYYQSVVWNPEASAIPKLDSNLKYSAVTGINRSGTIVGRDRNLGVDQVLGWIYEDGQITALPGGISQEPGGINDNGVVAGAIRDPATGWQAVTWTNGELHTLNSIGGSAFATDINNDGTIAGAVGIPGKDYCRASYWTAGSDNPSLFDTLPGRSAAYYISSNGLMAGLTNYGLSSAAAFLVRDGVVEFYPRFDRDETLVNGINSSGVMVGWSADFETTERQRIIGALWFNGVSYDFNDLFDGSDNGRYVVVALYGINDAGTIVGNVYDRIADEEFAAKFNPVPEPISVIALTVGVLALTRKRRR